MIRLGLFNKQRLAALVAVVGVLFGAAVHDAAQSEQGAPASASDWLLTQEQQLFELHNAYREAQGRPALTRDPLLDAVARDWTARMAATEVLEHRNNLRFMVEDQVTTEWTRIGENVGYGPSIEWLHDAFVASPGHEANIVGDYNRIGIGAIYDDDGDVWVTVNFIKGPELTVLPPPPLPVGTPADGWLVSEHGVVNAVGNAQHFGDLAGVALNQPIVTIASTPSGNGYWLAASDGGIFTFGDAPYLGSTGHIRLNQPIVGMAPTPSGNGYWLVASDGGIFTFGDAGYHGSTGDIVLNQPIVGMAPTPSGNGYWLVASDGGIFTFGDAGYHGSTGGIRLNQPIVGMAATPSGKGYWLVASDGGIFTFGDARYEGSAGEAPLAAPVGGMAAADASDDDAEYWIYTADGLVLSYGSGIDGWAAQAPQGFTAISASLLP